MKNLLIFTFILSLLSLDLTAQINSKTKWGQISDNEINYTECSFEKEAGAVILYEEGTTFVARLFETTVYRRIKILNEKGIEAANQEILYYAHNGNQQISSLKAQTINIENGKRVTHSVNRSSFFDTKINDFWSVQKFTFPNVKVGSILEFEYVMSEKGLMYINAWQFQHELPTIYSRYSFTNNSSLDYISLAIGQEITRYSKKMGNKGLRNWELSNLPSYNTIEYVYNPKDISERIVFQLKGYTKRDARGQQADYEHVVSKWSDLNKEIHSKYRDVISNSVGKEIAQTIPNGATEMETIQNVYNYFKSNYTWTRTYGISPRQTNREVQKSKSGNSADLNLLFYSILKNKGIETELLLLSSRSNGKLVISYPFLGQFDSVVNLVKLSTGEAFMVDASDMSFDITFAPLKNYNYYSLIIDGKNEDLTLVSPPISEYQSTQNYVIKGNIFLLNRNEKRNGYFRQEDDKIPNGVMPYNPIKNALDLFTTETRTQTRDENNSQMARIQSETSEFSNLSFITVENPLKNIVLAYKLNDANRERALEFDFPFHYKSTVSIPIPEGFKAEIPANYSTQNAALDGFLVYSQIAEIKDGKLLIHSEFYLGKSIITDDFKSIKSFFDKSNTAANQVILLKKG